MPYNRGSKRSTKSKGYSWNGFHQSVNTAGKVASTAYTALKIAQGVSALVNAESKYTDTNILSTINDAGTINLLSGLNEGVDNTMRNGRSVKFTSAYITGSIAQNSSATETIARVMLFIDKATAGGTPQILDVLRYTDYTSPLNVENAGNRFRILFDRSYAFSNSGSKIIDIKEFVKLNLHTTYLGTGPTISECGTNSIFLLLIGSEATNDPGVDLTCRLQFFDN